MNPEIISQLKLLYQKHFNHAAEEIEAMPQSGSNRQYYRIKGKPTVIGVYNSDIKENEAFLYFADFFKSKGLPVPAIYATGDNRDIYLLEDLGDTTLFSIIETDNQQNTFTDRLKSLYFQVLKILPSLQVEASKELDYSKCYPRKKFDRQSMLWDLNYFKYYFLKLAGIHFDEEKLENDFHTFMDFLSKAPSHYFLYRDFQSRNIMIKEDGPYFIDFQGGRQGALQYDIASLLYDAKANIPQHLRDEFLEVYLNELSHHIVDLDKEKFREFFYGFVLIRIMQAMGAYGYRGFFEGKKHFLKSIPFAIENLKQVLEHYELPVKVPELEYAFRAIIYSEKLQAISKQGNKLNIEINSFSYKRAIPVDTSGHGGGFVFDCRALPNPGRFEAFKHLTGTDSEVIHFLNEEPEVHKFLENSWSIISQSVEKYLERNFDHLSVSFGCTGGQHRSVYTASKIAARLKDTYPVNIKLTHHEID